MTSVVPKLVMVTHSAGATQALAARLAARLAAGDVLWLSGDLGAGKTTFTQGLGRGLGIAAPINSPTFVLIREYSGRLPLYHIDLYRLGDAREVAALGLSDYLAGDGVCVLEWAERLDARGALPGLHIRIEQPAAGVTPDGAEDAVGRSAALDWAEDAAGRAVTRELGEDAAGRAVTLEHGGDASGEVEDAAGRPAALERGGDATQERREDTRGGHVALDGAEDTRGGRVAPMRGGEATRVLTLVAAGERAERLLSALREDNLADAARN